MRSHKMTMETHMATAFSEEDVNEETLILTFEESQQDKILAKYDNAKYVYTLNEYIGDERKVHSAHGKPLNVYGENFELLQELIKKLATKLNSEAR